MTQVLLVPGNPLALRPEDLEPLVEQIRSGNDLTVNVHTDQQRGYGVTWWEVLYLYVGAKALDTVVGHPIQLLLDEVTDKLKEWYRARCEKNEKDEEAKAGSKRRSKNKKLNNARPFYFEIRDEDGYVRRAFLMYSTGEVEYRTDEAREKPLRPIPKALDDPTAEK